MRFLVLVLWLWLTGAPLTPARADTFDERFSAADEFKGHQPERSNAFLAQFLLSNPDIEQNCRQLMKAPIDKVGDKSACVAFYQLIREYAQKIKDKKAECTEIEKKGAASLAPGAGDDAACDQTSCLRQKLETTKKALAVKTRALACHRELLDLETRASSIDKGGFRPYYDHMIGEINKLPEDRAYVAGKLHRQVDR